MIQLYDKSKNKIAGLTCYTNLSIEHMLESGDKTLSFSYAKNNNFYFDIEEECYIKTKENEYVVKELNVQDDYTEYKCILNLEDLEGKPIESFESKEQPIDKALSLAIAGTGWIIGACNVSKKRTIRITDSSALGIINEARKVYRCDIVFNTLSKTMDIYEHLGEDKGTYLIDSLNLQSLNIQGNTYDYCTRIIPIGKDRLTIQEVNNGKNYVENYQYSSKVKTIYWKDDRYTIAQNLKEDAELKLNELSKPFKSYSCKLINLAKISEEYKDILDYNLGDTITLISKENKIKDKQRIVKIVEYPEEHEKDTIELANTMLCFEDVQTQFQEAADTVDNITTDNGTVDGSTIDEIKSNQISDLEVEVAKIVKLDVINANINNLTAQNVTITGKLDVVTANIGTLTTNVATIDKLTVTHSATIKELQSNKANITDLEVANATIKVLEANAAKIETLVSGNLSSENIQSGGITGDRLNMKTIFVEDANIVSVNANKINVGELNTNKVKIKSENGGIEIIGATQQFKDKNNRVRIQMGQDTQGNFNFIIKGEDGTTTLIDHNGIKEKAIADDLIKSNMIASDSVGEKQIDYGSFTTGFNKDTNTTTLKATKIRLDNQNQTLEVAFNTLKSTTDSNTNVLSSHTTQLNVQQGKIDTIIQDTTIVKDGQTLKLKDEYNKTIQTVSSMQSTIGSHTTKIDEVTGKVTNVETSVNIVKKDLNSITQKLSSTETNISSIEDSVNNNKSEITTTKNKVSIIESSLSSITNRVSSVETTTSNMNGTVSSLNTRLNNAEEKITDSAIVSTVTKSNVYRNDLNGKVSSNTIISSINQTAEQIKISANKIQLEGTTTLGGQGRHIRMRDNDICFYEKSTEYSQDLKLEIGFQENGFAPGTYIPKIRMGTHGMNPEAGALAEGNYVLINHFPGTNNPDKSESDLFSITHRNKLTNNWNGYRSYGNGRIALVSGDDEIYLEGKSGVRINHLNIYDISPTTLGRDVGTILMHCSLNGNGKNLGHSASKFNQVCAIDGYFNNLYSNGVISCDTSISRAIKGANGGSILMHSSLDGNGKNLGWSGSKFNQVSAKAVWADSGNVSDIRLKENIRYLDTVEVRGVKVNPPILKQNTKTESDFVDIAKEDLYNFIKNELKLCEFNYIDSASTKTNFDYKIGFIANDVEGTKVGNKFVHKHEGILGYNLNTFVFILAGALQEEIKYRESLEYKLKKLIGETI